MKIEIGLGTVLAIIMSWERNHDILWAVFHAFCGWFYVLWWAFTYR
jgi:hypothetical protein